MNYQKVVGAFASLVTAVCGFACAPSLDLRNEPIEGPRDLRVGTTGYYDHSVSVNADCVNFPLSDDDCTPGVSSEVHIDLVETPVGSSATVQVESDSFTFFSFAPDVPGTYVIRVSGIVEANEGGETTEKNFEQEITIEAVLPAEGEIFAELEGVDFSDLTKREGGIPPTFQSVYGAEFLLPMVDLDGQGRKDWRLIPNWKASSQDSDPTLTDGTYVYHLPFEGRNLMALFADYDDDGRDELYVAPDDHYTYSGFTPDPVFQVVFQKEAL